MHSRSVLFSGGTPGHSLLRSAAQCVTLRCRSGSCAVAFDDHNIKTAPLIRMIFTTEGLSLPQLNIRQRRTYQFRDGCEIDLNQMGDTASRPRSLSSHR
jgi:hypothetical protein